jgi:hypothetical protein
MKRNILKNLKTALKQMQTIRSGKLPKKTWDDYLKENNTKITEEKMARISKIVDGLIGLKTQIADHEKELALLNFKLNMRKEMLNIELKRDF